MTNAELIQAFRAEIEMRIKECEATYPKGGYWFPEQEEAYAIAEEYKQLLSFLGTLEDGASEKPNNQMEIVNDLTSEVPTRAVQLPNGRWVTEAFANDNCIYGRKPEERHCEYCSANCSTGHDFQRTKGLDEAANAYSNEHNDDCFDAIGSVCHHIIEAFKAGYNLCKEQMPLPEDTVLFNKGVAEGRRLAEEEQADLLTIAHLQGADQMKEQMMKDGLDAVKTLDFNKVEKTIAGVFVKYGMDRQKEQMLKDAVEWTVTTNLANRPVIYLDELHGFKYGDKVRVIVCKKEDEK